MSTRPTILLLPGFMCTEDLWRDQIAALSAIGNCLVADMSAARTLPELATIALDTMPDRFCLAGFSLGGYLAQEIFRQAPGRVTRLALIDTGMHADTPARRAQRADLSRAASAPGAFAGISDSILKSYIHPSRHADRDLTGRIRAMTRSLGREVFLAQSAMVRPDGESVLHGLSCPTKVICGAQDLITPVSIHEEIATAVKGAELVVIDNCGHMSPMEQPDRVSRELVGLFCD